MPERRVVAMGGAPDDSLLDYVLGLARGPRLLYVPTAGMEQPSRTVEWYERLRGRAEMTSLHFFPWPPAELRRLALGHDIVLVTGGIPPTPSRSGARTVSTKCCGRPGTRASC